MPATGAHDDFESAARLIRRVYAEFNRTQDIEATLGAYVADDLEHVTRDGTFHGRDRWLGETLVQLKSWRIEIEIEDVIDAGDGALIVQSKVSRIDRETGKVVWKAWPAIVMRVLDGRAVFFEGYVDRRKAMAGLGLDQR